MSSSISELNFIASLAERDVDITILEELEVSAEFGAWFSARIYEISVFKEQIGAWHSVTQAGLGESDIVFLFEAMDGSTKSILIENKIDAPPQPDQGVRYQKRGELGVQRSDWDEFRTCIIAPRKYLGSSKHSEIYDAEISYEEIMEYFQERGLHNRRSAYRARIMKEGIEQNRRGYQRVVSEAATVFYEEYVSFARNSFPELGVEDAKAKPAASSWIRFYPKGKSKGNLVLHQLSAGYGKVLLGGKAGELDTYRQKYADQPIADLEIERAGKSLGLVISVPKIDPTTERFVACHARASEAMQKLAELVSMAKSRGDI